MGSIGNAFEPVVSTLSYHDQFMALAGFGCSDGSMRDYLSRIWRA